MFHRPYLCALGLAALLSIASPGAAQLLGGSKKSSKDPASFTVKVEPAEMPRGGRGEIVVGYEVEAPWWIYAPDHAAPSGAGKPTRIIAEHAAIQISSAHTTDPPPEVKIEKDLDNETHRILKKKGTIRRAFQVKIDAAPGEVGIPVTIEYMACDPQGCRPPAELKLEAVLRVKDGPPVEPAAGDPAKAGGPPPENGAPEAAGGPGAGEPKAEVIPVLPPALPPPGDPAVPLAPAPDNPVEKAGLIAFIFLMIGGGLFALVMPCTYPMIPITISYFTKQAEARQGAILPLALAYGAGIVVIFIIVGVVFGSLMILIAANPWVNLVFALAFVVFALALFGIYELRLPSSWSQLAPKASGSGGFVGVFLLGTLLVVTSFTCTAPILGSLLVAAAKGGNLGRLVLGMGVFGTTIAVPFVLLSLFPAKVRSLPRAGEWMHSLKVSLGFLELAAALKFFSNADIVFEWYVLPRELFFIAWCAIFGVLGLYLLGLFRLKGEEAHGIGGTRMLFGLTSIILALYFFHGSQGNRLDWLSEVLTAPFSAKKDAVGWSIVEDDLDAALARAKAEGKRALINFTGIT